MHVISRKRLKEFWEIHPDAEGELKAWHAEAEHARWRNSAELKARYISASIINSERVVFNICHNKYRLIVRIDYIYQLIFIRFIGTHHEYDKVNAENV